MTRTADNSRKIVLQDVHKSFRHGDADVEVFGGVTLSIDEGEFVCVVGPTGCGKTTMLNIIAGLERATSGVVRVDGKDVRGPGPERGVVFQQYALFPWLTARQNVEFALSLGGVPRADLAEKARYYLSAVGMLEYENVLPKQMSGGMKQRVAIARAYAGEPSVLLMDEPFGALDAQTKVLMQQDLFDTWTKLTRTVFFITHDVEEAVFLGQRILVLSRRPATIVAEIPVHLPRERKEEMRFTKAFADIKNQVWRLLGYSGNSGVEGHH